MWSAKIVSNRFAIFGLLLQVAICATAETSHQIISRSPDSSQLISTAPTSGKFLGDITTTRGVTYKDAKVVRVEEDVLRISYSINKSAGIARIPFSELPSDLQNLRVTSSELLREERRIQEKEAKKPEEAYELTKKSVARMKRNINWFVGPDVDLAEQLIRDGERYVREYETGDEQAKLVAYTVHTQMWTQVLENKPVYGYQYNEFLKQETTVPITFNIFKDSNSFYIQVGDGAFCTVATLSSESLLKLVEQFIKINEWSQKCVEEKIDAIKDAGSFGGVTLEFVSKNNAENIYVWLTARGEFAEDRLVEKQTVRVNMLNLHALMRRIAKAKDLYEQRARLRSNADRLK